MIKFISIVGMILLIGIELSAQVITGKIVTENEKPVTGANIFIKNTSIGSVSDAQGAFELAAKDLEGNFKLIVSHISFENKSLDLRIDPVAESIDLGQINLYQIGIITEPLTIRALRVDKSDPFVSTTLSQGSIEERNHGQDIPQLLEFTPSLISTSDAGNGIGYTALRIRGTDQSRINVTINGIPYNDAESQQVFWVDLPDFASSTQTIQIQRGLGSSTNGAGAFGGSINLNTLTINEKQYLDLDNAFGSYNTRKHSLRMGTGLINDRISLDVRLSKIASDGYVDRASSDLQSYYLAGNYKGDKSQIHLILSSGKERTYQSWYGTPEARISGEPEALQAFADRNFLSEPQTENLLESGRRYNFYTYENQVDDYKQDHYQAHFMRSISNQIEASASLHFTKGKGFFEEYRSEDDLNNYNLVPVEIGGQMNTTSDIVRRRWLDNDFYGLVYNLNYRSPNKQSEIILGGAANKYEGLHFGELIWADFGPSAFIGDRYYTSSSEKEDWNLYVKGKLSLSESINSFVDLQLRGVDYMTEGTDNDLKRFSIDKGFIFFNPKVGFNYNLSGVTAVYASVGVGHREPDRNDFINEYPVSVPMSERLIDFETGLRYFGSSFSGELNLYYMDYKDQLILTGALNDVGAPLRQNVPDSYRAGIEISCSWLPVPKLKIDYNATLSRNKVKQFKEVIYDYSGAEVRTVENEYQNTNISFSPSVVMSGMVEYNPTKRLSFSLLNKYVGKQFLDNTSNQNRMFDDYLYSELNSKLQLYPKYLESIQLHFSIRNLFNRKYTANGYTFSYIFNDLITENFYYPQAERHFMAGVNLVF